MYRTLHYICICLQTHETFTNSYSCILCSMISESVHLRGEKKDYQPEVGADVRTAGRMKNDAMGDSS